MTKDSPTGASAHRNHGRPGCVIGVSWASSPSSVVGSDSPTVTDGGVAAARWASGGGDGSGNALSIASSDVEQFSGCGTRNLAWGQPALPCGAGSGDTSRSISSGVGVWTRYSSP